MKVLGLDISTTTVGMALIDDGKLIHHEYIPLSKLHKSSETNKDLIIKRDMVMERMNKLQFDMVYIEEPLMRAINVNTVAMLIKFNYLIVGKIWDEYNMEPIHISSYNARKIAFPELMALRNERSKQKTLFGAYDKTANKKQIIFNKVLGVYPEIKSSIEYKRSKKEPKDEMYDITDAICIALAANKLNETK